MSGQDSGNKQNPGNNSSPVPGCSKQNSLKRKRDSSEEEEEEKNKPGPSASGSSNFSQVGSSKHKKFKFHNNSVTASKMTHATEFTDHLPFRKDDVGVYNIRYFDLKAISEFLDSDSDSDISQASSGSARGYTDQNAAEKCSDVEFNIEQLYIDSDDSDSSIDGIGGDSGVSLDEEMSISPD